MNKTKQNLSKEADFLRKYEKNIALRPYFYYKKIKKGAIYEWHHSDECYMRVYPINETSKIPGGFDEKIFYGVLRLAEKRKSGVIITDYVEIAEHSGVSVKNIKGVKDSIQKLRFTIYECRNFFYRAGCGLCEQINFSLLDDLQVFENESENGEIIKLQIAWPIYNNLQAGFCLETKYAVENLTSAERKFYFCYLHAKELHENCKKQYKKQCKEKCEKCKICIKFKDAAEICQLPFSVDDSDVLCDNNLIRNIFLTMSFANNIMGVAGSLLTLKLIKFIPCYTEQLKDSYFEFYF